MKEEMIEFLEKTQLPIYFEERKIIKEFIKTFFDSRQSENVKREDDVMYLKCAEHNKYCHIDDIYRSGGLNSMET